jgi:hypothetical protein
MSATRRSLAALAALAVLALYAHAGPPPGDAGRLTADSAEQQAQLKRAFEAFRQKLAVLAGRLEASAAPDDRERAKALRRGLALAADRGVGEKFDGLVRALSRPDAGRNLDVLARVVRENKELRQDLQKLIRLLAEDDAEQRLARRALSIAQLMEMLKDLRNRQERLQALTDRGKDKPADLAAQQEKLARQTAAALPPPDKDAPKDSEEPMPVEVVRKPVGEAAAQQKQAARMLAKGNRGGGSDAQGRAVGKLNEAISLLEGLLQQTRREEKERKLNNLLARCKKMLAIQKEVLQGTEKLAGEMRKSAGRPASVAQAARGNRLADLQDASLQEDDATLEIIRVEGVAVVFAEVLGQARKDMTTVKRRLVRLDVGVVTLAVEADLVQTLQDVVAALEKAIQENQKPGRPGRPGEGGPNDKQKLVTRLQQLKLVAAAQRRINRRTTLYGQRFRGEQAPAPARAVNETEKKHLQEIVAELAELAGRQDRLARVTREVSRQKDDRGANID